MVAGRGGYLGTTPFAKVHDDPDYLEEGDLRVRRDAGTKPLQTATVSMHLYITLFGIPACVVEHIRTFATYLTDSIPETILVGSLPCRRIASSC